jgi:hypothetical protein
LEKLKEYSSETLHYKLAFGEFHLNIFSQTDWDVKLELVFGQLFMCGKEVAFEVLSAISYLNRLWISIYS